MNLPPPSLNLTPQEIVVAMDSGFIFAKQKVIEKVYGLFGALASEFAVEFSNAFPAIKAGNAKISKGENYRGLPYVMLDFPRFFSKNDVFAIRCFFWWGNFFTITLHLSGSYKEQYSPALAKAVSEQLFDNWHCCHADDEWQHHFEPDNFTTLNSSSAETFAGRRFIKLAKKIPLTEWDNAYKFFTDNYCKLLASISYQAPMR